MNRILQITDLETARMELLKIGVSSGGVEAMAAKSKVLAIKLHQIKLGAANILKQEMLSIGGDAAVAKGVVEGKIGKSDVILLGSEIRIKRLIKKLDKQSIFGLTAIKEDLKKLIASRNSNPLILKLKHGSLDLNTVKLMGILNVTPDSFSDGSEFLDQDSAFLRAMEMIKEGADIIDIGGESSRPGAAKVSTEKELDRVIPVINRIRSESDIPISIDTTKSEVAFEAVKAGADVLNDISSLRFDAAMVDVLKENPQVVVILMHMQGDPLTMQQSPHYNDVVPEILSFFEERINFCYKAGIDKERILIDPGIGFGKRQQDNLEIIRKLSEFKCLERPIVFGASRKSFIGRIYESNVNERLEGSLAAAAQAFQQGAKILRVHDVLSHKRFLKTLQEIG